MTDEKGLDIWVDPWKVFGGNCDVFGSLPVLASAQQLGSDKKTKQDWGWTENWGWDNMLPNPCSLSFTELCSFFSLVCVWGTENTWLSNELVTCPGCTLLSPQLSCKQPCHCTRREAGVNNVWIDVSFLWYLTYCRKKHQPVRPLLSKQSHVTVEHVLWSAKPTILQFN